MQETTEKLRSLFIGRNDCKVNVGCGTNPVSDWINLDLIDYPGVYKWDCTDGLPFEDGSVAIIFGEHIYEHSEVPSETQHFLYESLRCLKMARSLG